MDGRAFLNVARRLAQEPTEADWRTAAGRAYYALMLEGKTVRKVIIAPGNKLVNLVVG